MQDEQNKPMQDGDENKKENTAATQSSADRKNVSNLHQTPAATERVKPQSGDGLANEGTNVSYEEGR